MPLLLMRMWLNPMVGMKTVDVAMPDFSKATKRNPGGDQSQNREKKSLVFTVENRIT